jgi:broad specificity phosphatase PhoE
MLDKHRVFLVRHAMRADEAPQEPAGVPKKVYQNHDPPLAKLGEEQACQAARHIVGTLSKTFNIPSVYTSPYSRCVQTAYPLAKQLQASLVVEPALGVCANSFVKCQANARALPAPPSTLAELKLSMPDIALEVAGVLPECEEAFLPALERIARKSAASSQQATLAVTHREGIRMLDRHCGETERMSTPYCVVHEYEFNAKDNRWRLVYDSVVCVPEPSSLFPSGQSGRRRDREFAFSSLTTISPM